MLFLDIEGMVAKDFDKGLAKLKTLSESAPATSPMTTTSGSTPATTTASH